MVQDGQTELLVDNAPEAWLEALTRLVEGLRLRGRIGQAARRELQQRFHETWLEHIEQAMTTQALPVLSGYSRS